jgi:hypothetical protein
VRKQEEVFDAGVGSLMLSLRGGPWLKAEYQRATLDFSDMRNT